MKVIFLAVLRRFECGQSYDFGDDLKFIFSTLNLRILIYLTCGHHDRELFQTAEKQNLHWQKEDFHFLILILLRRGFLSTSFPPMVQTPRSPPTMSDPKPLALQPLPPRDLSCTISRLSLKRFMMASDSCFGTMEKNIKEIMNV